MLCNNERYLPTLGVGGLSSVDQDQQCTSWRRLWLGKPIHVPTDSFGIECHTTVTSSCTIGSRMGLQGGIYMSQGWCNQHSWSRLHLPFPVGLHCLGFSVKSLWSPTPRAVFTVRSRHPLNQLPCVLITAVHIPRWDDTWTQLNICTVGIHVLCCIPFKSHVMVEPYSVTICVWVCVGGGGSGDWVEWSWSGMGLGKVGWGGVEWSGVEWNEVGVGWVRVRWGGL